MVDDHGNDVKLRDEKCEQISLIVSDWNNFYGIKTWYPESSDVDEFKFYDVDKAVNAFYKLHGKTPRLLDVNIDNMTPIAKAPNEEINKPIGDFCTYDQGEQIIELLKDIIYRIDNV